MPTETVQNTRVPPRLNLGCGRDQPAGWHNVDVAADVAPDEQVDLERTPWPWSDDRFDVIRAWHVLEHLNPVPWGEICRVLTPDGRLELRYPIGHTRFEDATHQQFWNLNTAATLAGERDHTHEHVGQLSLVDRDVYVRWSVDSPLLRWWVRWHRWRDGIGPWIEQVPGVYGEVRATYRLEADR